MTTYVSKQIADQIAHQHKAHLRMQESGTADALKAWILLTTVFVAGFVVGKVWP